MSKDADGFSANRGALQTSPRLQRKRFRKFRFRTEPTRGELSLKAYLFVIAIIIIIAAATIRRRRRRVYYYATYITYTHTHI